MWRLVFKRVEQRSWLKYPTKMRYEVTIPVAEDATFIRFGLVLYGKGQIWLANARLEVIEQGGMLSA